MSVDNTEPRKELLLGDLTKTKEGYVSFCLQEIQRVRAIQINEENDFCMYQSKNCSVSFYFMDSFRCSAHLGDEALWKMERCLIHKLGNHG